MSPTVYEIINEKVINLLQSGHIPWKKPWKPGDAPRNFRGTSYRGVNVWILEATRQDKNYKSNIWLTYNQAQGIKNAEGLTGQVRKGEHGTPVIFWHFIENKTKDKNDKKTVIPMLRYYTVFNYDQIDNLPELVIPESTLKSVEMLERVYLNMPGKPEIKRGGDRAFYSPSLDYIGLPPIEQFKGTSEYYSTLYHEMGHSTGHETRLNRFSANDQHNFGSEDYSKEELVAEMTAGYLCGEMGIVGDTLTNTAAYIESWLRALKDDKTMLVKAGGQAQKAADYILGRKPEDQKES
jgi:antirestriction protein ArdC